MTDQVQAVVMPAPGRPLEMRSFPGPRPGPGEAVLETVASEVCGTDVHLHHGRLAGVPYPIIPGHVSVGRVVALANQRTKQQPQTRRSRGAFSRDAC